MTKSYRVITPKKYQRAEVNGVKKKALEARIRVLRWPIQKAINKPTAKNTKHGDWIKRAEANGINRSSYYRRISDGLSPEKAATDPVKGKVTKDGKPKPAWKDMKERAAQKNVSYSTYMRRLSEGESPEEAISRPPLNSREHMKRQVESGKIKYAVKG